MVKFYVVSLLGFVRWIIVELGYLSHADTTTLPVELFPISRLPFPIDLRWTYEHNDNSKVWYLAFIIIKEDTVSEFHRLVNNTPPGDDTLSTLS